MAFHISRCGICGLMNRLSISVNVIDAERKKYSLPLYFCAIVLRRSKHAAPLIRMKSCIPYTNLQCMHNTTKHPYPTYIDTLEIYNPCKEKNIPIVNSKTRYVLPNKPNVSPILRRPFPEPHQIIHDPFFILRPTAFATTPLRTKPPFITTLNMIQYIYVNCQIAHPQARLAQ
jgi:hypothetical protein